MTSDLDDERERLHAAIERIGANLLQLEDDPTYVLLGAADLHGSTATRWDAVTRSMEVLYQCYAALRVLADRVATAARPSEVAELLRGPSIAVADTAVPVAARGLLGGSRMVVRQTLDEVLREMSRSFDSIGELLETVTRAWSELPPQVRELRERLAAVSTEPAADAIERQLDDLSHTILGDPVSAERSRLDAISVDIDGIVDAHRDVTAVREGWNDELASARRMLQALRSAVGEASAARAHRAARVLAPPDHRCPPAARPSPDDAAAALDRIEALAAEGAWPMVAVDLRAWSRDVAGVTAAATTEAGAERALVATRDELRGRLDAYHAKAGRLGLLEDGALAADHDAALAALHDAPIDLTHAATLVAQYGDVVGRRLDRQPDRGGR